VVTARSGSSGSIRALRSCVPAWCSKRKPTAGAAGITIVTNAYHLAGLAGVVDTGGVVGIVSPRQNTQIPQAAAADPEESVTRSAGIVSTDAHHLADVIDAGCGGIASPRLRGVRSYSAGRQLPQALTQTTKDASPWQGWTGLRIRSP
jgi:hypothetical protein